jgi:hypothetical protein
MDNLLLAVDLDHGPVGVHVGDLAAAEPPHQPGALQVFHRAPRMTCEHTRGVPAEISGALRPVAEKVVNVVQENAPAMCWYSGMRW